MVKETIINLVDSGSVYTLIHMCTDIFRIIGKGEAFVSDPYVSNVIDCGTTNKFVRDSLVNTIKHFGIEGIPKHVLEGEFVTKEEFDELYPKAIMFKVTLVYTNDTNLSSADEARVQTDMQSWSDFTRSFLTLLGNDRSN